MRTYQDLLEHLKTLPPERLQDTVTVYDVEEEEYYPVCAIEQAPDTDVLDKDHTYLVIKVES